MRLIDAEFVKKKMQEIMDYQDAYLPIHFEGILEDAPTVDAEPIKHGHWIGEGDGYADGELVYDTWYCSNCDYVVENDDCEPDFKYCPHCGAKMDDVENYIPKEEYNIPTVNEGIQEGRKLIFCKDCMWWEVDNDVGFCVRTEDCDWNADDFCSKGEKKDE